MFASIHVPGISPERHARLLECASDFSPWVEETAPDTVTLDIGSLTHLFGSPRNVAEAMARRAAELGLAANVAVAANPDAAVHGARGFAGTVVMSEKEAGLLPSELLEAPPEIAATLAMWGIRTFGEFAALPEDGIAERLGPLGVHLQKLARGAGNRPLKPANPPPAFEESFDLEYPLVLLEPLSFLLARLLGALCARLDSHGLATHELRLRLKLENGGAHERTLRLPFPMRDAKAFLKLLSLDLDAHSPPAPVTAVSLSAEPVNPRVVQHGLFLPPAPEPQKLELTLARIAKLVGEGNVGSPELLDTHRPGAFRLKRFTVARPLGCRVGTHADATLALRVFRPALRAQVQAPNGRPARVEARGVRGRVLQMAGPWRTSGDWWRPDTWSRDEWDVTLSGGALYRLYRDRHGGEWFVEGRYD
ncbi:MAG: DNA polymerase Y family protein [Bryobacteraceae bacterium]|jgi:protein ImuB